MDKKQFCDDAAVKLRDIDRYFQLQREVSPATAHRATQISERRPRLAEARERVEKLRSRVNQVCSDTSPLSTSVHTEIEQEFAAVKTLLSA